MEATSSARTARPAQPLRLLSLDGGGIRGLSELIILERIMHRVKLAGNLRHDPRPADYFDLICGTSTGGLIAILLGRLQLTVPEAIDNYCRLSKSVFSEQKPGWKDGTFKASRLEEAIKSVLEELYDNKRERDRRMLSSGRALCKTFVVAVPALNIDRPRLFRNYVSKNPYYNAKIWEVARATSAAPRFFKRISVGRPGMEEEFVDGALGYNNPAELAIREAREEHTQDQHVACILSIGTGRRRAAGFQKPGKLQRAFPTELIETLKSIATSCERVAQEMQERYRNCPGLYHRLNVEVGMDDIALEEWDRLGEVTTHTQAYLDGPDVSREIDVIVESLLGRPRGSYPLATLDGTVQESNRSEFPMFLYPSFAVVHFVDRPRKLHDLDVYLRRPLTPPDELTPKVVLLQGMGGCGKSQLALNYCQTSERKRRYSIILWIDATSPQTAFQSISNVAKQWLKPVFQSGDQEGNLQFVRNRLNDERSRWLLIFDNFDEPESFRRKKIQDFIPRHGPGSVIITSRRVEVQALAHKSLNLDRLSPDESVSILLGRTKRAPDEDNQLECARIVERLGYHALAIDQAGAYMLTRGMEFASYLEFYGQQRRKVLNEAPNIWNYTKLSKDSAEGMKNCTIFATLELSLDSISGEEQEQKDKKHILTLMAFFDINKLKDTIFHPYGRRRKRWMVSCQGNKNLNKDAFQDVLSELHNLSLLQSLEINSSGAFFTIHPLVQDWLKARIGKEQAKQYIVESMLVFSEYLCANGASDNFHYSDFHARQFMVAHVDATILAKQEFFDSWSFLQESSLLNAGSYYCTILGRQGRYHQAAELCGAVLAARTNESGEEHPEALWAMHNLSLYLNEQGKYEKAEPLIRKCVAIYIKLHGKEAVKTLQSMDTLTALLIMQENYEEADSTSKEAMEVSVAVLGRDHINTISIIRHRASVLNHLGNYSEAASMNKENLEVSKRVLGIQPPFTLIIMNNLALCLRKLERFEEAGTLLREILSSKEKIYPPDHPQTLKAIYNLAVNLYKQAKLIEAEELFWRAYPGYESLHGWQHPDSISFLGRMANCLRDLSKYEEAERIINLLPESDRAWRIQRLEKRKSRMAVRDRRRY